MHGLNSLFPVIPNLADVIHVNCAWSYLTVSIFLCFQHIHGLYSLTDYIPFLTFCVVFGHPVPRKYMAVNTKRK